MDKGGKVAVALVVLIGLAVVALAITGPFVGTDAQHKAHDSAIAIHLVGPDGSAGCSATAIGPHALLTANHCSRGDGEMLELPGLGRYVISKHIFDGRDGLILIVPGLTLIHTFPFKPSGRDPIQGESAWFFGNPQMVTGQFRTGVVMGSTKFPGDDVAPGVPVFIFNMNAQPGDSGSMICDSEGRPLAVLTYGIDGGLFSGAYPLAFTPEQLKGISQ